MASKTDIANRALSKLGDIRVSNVDLDDSKAARAMRARFDFLRDAELEAHPWRFAIKRDELPALVDAPAWGYARAYQIPADAHRIITIGDMAVNVETLGVQYQVSTGYNPSQAAYEIIGDQIQTDLTAPLKVEYIRRVENTGEFTALFVEALASRMAMDAAEELTQSDSKKQFAAGDYKEAITEARRINAIQRPPGERVPGRWLMSRYNA